MWFDRRRRPRIADEVRFHRDQLIDDYVAAGMDRREAERRAFIALGNAPAIEENVRDARGRWLEYFVADVRYACRVLRRSPGFTMVAVLSLALGIGANTAIFSVVNAVMLRTLPVREADRLVLIARLRPDGRPAGVSYRLFELMRDNLQSVSGMFAQGASEQAITIDGEQEFVLADLVSGAYHAVLGIAPAAGRLLTPADDVWSPMSPAAVISDRYWERRFGRSPSAIGKTFTLRDRVFTIVGVTPPSFQSARPGHAPDITLPLLMMTSENQRREITNNWLSLIARLKPGATVEQADAEVQVVWSAVVRAQAAEAPEKSREEILRQRATAQPAADGVNPLRYDFAPPLLMLMASVGLVLLLACVNLSGLLLARAAARQREISIRLALGAGSSRLVRQFLTESLVLAAIGGAIALVVAGWFSSSLVGLVANGSPLVLSVGLDGRVVAFTAGVSVLACVLAGLAPALYAVRTTVNPALKTVRAQGSSRLGKMLVVAQLGLSMVLVVGATLFVGTLVKLYAVDRGFASDGLLIVSLRSARPYGAERAIAVQGELLERLRQLPGARSASAAQVLPISGSLWNRTVQVEGYVFRSDESESVGFNVIAPDYFATLGTPLVAGREFDARDSARSPKTAIVNESFARFFFGAGSPIGRRVTSLDVTYEIVGVVRDAKYQNLRTDVIRTMYIPWTQREGDQPSRYNYILRAHAGDPLRLGPGVERLVHAADPGLSVRSTLTYATLVDRSIVAERIMAALGGLFGALALCIAALGVFGVLAFQVARRTSELGVRMALGATGGAMMRLILRDLAVMVAAGVSIGAMAALMLAGFARSILFGLTPTEPLVFAAAAMVLACAAAAAGWLPAQRAARVDPLIALRHE